MFHGKFVKGSLNDESYVRLQIELQDFAKLHEEEIM